MSTIVFFTKDIDLRGTCVAIYDYAHFHEVLNKGRSLILAKSGDPRAIVKFQRRFRILWYKKEDDIESILASEKADIFYTIRWGKPTDGPLPKNIPSAVHCVYEMRESHGNSYFAVSSHVSTIYGDANKFVPHMIHLPQVNFNLRKELNIPSDAIVFGRYGGQDTFDIDFAKEAIAEIVAKKQNVWFIFMNTPKWANHERILHLNGCSMLAYKSAFINTCDAMIHAQFLGETFGITIGEFSSHHKPIITFGGDQWHSAHLDILGDSAIRYHNKSELLAILEQFKPTPARNLYTKYSPKLVMERFNKFVTSLV